MEAAGFRFDVEVRMVGSTLVVHVPPCLLDALARQEIADAVMRGAERLISGASDEDAHRRARALN